MSFQAFAADGSLVFASTQTPEPTQTTTQSPADELRPELNEYDVSPGLEGFLVTFGVAIALFVLLMFMTRRLRRVKHKEDANQRVTATFDGEGPKLASHQNSQESADSVDAPEATDDQDATVVGEDKTN